MIQMTKQQARQFLLCKHGLLGEHVFIGKQGAIDFIRQAGCIQFDPVDVCGKNAELTLQSRVKGFTKKILYELLYEDRLLVDFPDKNLSILPVDDWPYFERYRQAARAGGLQFPELEALEEQARNYIAENGPVSSDDLPIQGNIRWQSSIHWSGNRFDGTNAARAVLEQLYSTGELIIHHKQGARKFYALAKDYLPDSLLHTPDPIPDEAAHQKWRILRRISGIGLLWNRPSDAWLNIWGLKTAERAQAFAELQEEGKILPVQVEGMKNRLYCCAADFPLIQEIRGEASGIGIKSGKYKSRCEFLAPLDCLMWDRKLIEELFGFEYRWEIYTPVAKRKYGYYVLPILYGERFVGRIEAVADKKTRVLTVKKIWFEEGVRQTKKILSAIDQCIRRFAKFNECTDILKL